MSADTIHMLCVATFLLWSLPLNSTATHTGLRYFHWSLWLTVAKLGMRYYNRNEWAWKSSLSWWLSRTFSADWKIIDNPYLVGWIAEITFPGSPMCFFVNFQVFNLKTLPIMITPLIKQYLRIYHLKSASKKLIHVAFSTWGGNDLIGGNRQK